MWGLAIYLLILCSGGALCAALAQVRFERALPLTLLSAMAVLYLFGLCGALRAGVWAVCAAAAALWLFSAVRVCRTGGYRSFCSAFFTPAFCIFLFLFCVSALCNAGRVIQDWDEYTHWGDVVKAMFYLDGFAASPLSGTDFPNYPPAVSLLQYFVQRLQSVFCPSAAFSEWLLYPVCQTMFFALLAPFLSGLSHKNVLWNLLACLALFCLPAMIGYYAYRTVLVDVLLGLCAGCGMALLLRMGAVQNTPPPPFIYHI